VKQSSDDSLAISGSRLQDDRSEPDPSPANYSRDTMRSFSSSLTSFTPSPLKEDEPKILAHRVSEMDEAEALVVKPNPLFQGHLGA